MIELFEFRVSRKGERLFSDEFVDSFVSDFLEPRSLYWGGGGGDDYLVGVISSTSKVDLQKVTDDFRSFFGPEEVIEVELIRPEQDSK